MDPLSRPMFRDTEVTPFEAHQSMMKQYFNAGTRDCWFIIEAAQTPVGAVALYEFDERGRTCEWGRFVVAPEARGLGFGRRALRLLMAHAQKSGVRSLRCEVLSTNAVALNLYRDLGFVESAVREDGGRSFVELTTDLIGRV